VHLPHVLSREQREKRLRRALDAVDDRLAIADRPVRNPRRDLREERAQAIEVVEHDEALHPQPLRDDHEHVPRPRHRLRRVVARDRAARHDPPVPLERSDRRLERLAADVVEVHVDAVGREVAQRRARRRLVVVEARVEAELLEPGELLGAPGAADHPRPAQPRELSGEAADGPRRARDEDRVAVLHLRDVGDADEGGETWHAEHAERGRERRDGRVDRAGPRRVDERRLTPAEVVPDPCPLRQRVARGRDDLPDGAARERLTDGERRHVRADVVHPRPHVGVDRDERVADEDLTVHGVGKLDLLEHEVARCGQAARTGGKPDLPRPQRHGRILRLRRKPYGIF
jgi:hypothetical protein